MRLVIKMTLDEVQQMFLVSNEDIVESREEYTAIGLFKSGAKLRIERQPGMVAIIGYRDDGGDVLRALGEVLDMRRTRR